MILEGNQMVYKLTLILLNFWQNAREIISLFYSSRHVHVVTLKENYFVF